MTPKDMAAFWLASAFWSMLLLQLHKQFHAKWNYEKIASESEDDLPGPGLFELPEQWMTCIALGLVILLCSWKPTFWAGVGVMLQSFFGGIMLYGMYCHFYSFVWVSVGVWKRIRGGLKEWQSATDRLTWIMMILSYFSAIIVASLGYWPFR